MICLKGRLNLEKRYQVFVSSTFKDLEEERNLLTQTLLRKGCFPAGMELFPAIDEEQFEYIKQVIDDTDYYVIVLGGIYGSLASDGISYTEKEYDYAVSKNKDVIALIQRNPIQREEDERQVKFTEFRRKVSNGRLVSFWNNTEELASIFSTSLEQAMKKHPAPGWIRCNSSICDLRLEFCDMNAKISLLKIKSVKTIHIMASGTSSYIQTVKNIIKLNRNKKKVINIYIYFRLGNNLERISMLKNQYDAWWKNLKHENSNIKYHFICVNDFKMSFRGVVINRELGFVGFYIKDNNIQGTLEDCIYVDNNTNVGKYIIDCFMKCFKGNQEYPTLESCIENTIKK